MAGNLNHIIGSVRLTQFRLKKRPCEGANDIFKALVKNDVCFEKRHSNLPRHNPWTEEPFGPNLEYQISKVSSKKTTIYSTRRIKFGLYIK